MLFAMRFDFRNPAFAGTSTADRYAAAMCGGIPPVLAWESLRLFERDVLPAFQR